MRYHSISRSSTSQRPNTLASKRLRDDVTEEEKTRRIVQLQAHQREVQLATHEAMVGRTFERTGRFGSRRRDWEVSGRTTGNTVVNLPGAQAWIGRMVPVTIRRAGPNSLWGEPVTSMA